MPTRKVKKPSQKIQDEALRCAMSELRRVRKMTSNIRTKWQRWYKIVRSFQDDRLNTYNRVFLPLGWEQIEKIAPEIVAHNPQFDVAPTLNTVSTKHVEMVSDLLQFSWEMEDMSDELVDVVKSALIYGKGIVKLGIKRLVDSEVVEREEDEDGEMIEEVVEEREKFVVPTMENVDIFNFDIDPTVKSIEDAPMVFLTIESINEAGVRAMAKANGYFNLDKIADLSSSGSSVTGDNDRKENATVRGVNDSAAKKGKDDFVLREAWGQFSPTGNSKDMKEYVITILNDSLIIGLQENLYSTSAFPDGVRPFEAVSDHTVPGEFYGVGEIEPTESMQLGINKQRNQRLDNVDLTLNAMWLYERGAGINPKRLKSRPGNLIAVDDINAIRTMPVPNITSAGYAEEDRFIRDFQMATGALDTTSTGGRDGFTNTATGQKIAQKTSTSRYQMKVRNVERMIARMGKKFLVMLYAAVDDSLKFSRQDAETGKYMFVDLPKKTLLKMVNGTALRVRGGSTTATAYEDRRNDALAQYNMAKSAFGDGILEKEEFGKIFRDIMSTAFGVNNIVSRKQGGGLKSFIPRSRKPFASGLVPPEQTPSPQSKTPGGGQINPVTGQLNGLTPGVAI